MLFIKGKENEDILIEPSPKRKKQRVAYESPISPYKIQEDSSKQFIISNTINKKRKLYGDGMLWIDKYTPKKISKLVISPSKIDEVKEWLNRYAKTSHFSNPFTTPPLLIIRGPCGCGKSTLLNVLCSEIGVEVIEWGSQLSSFIEQGESDSSRFQHLLSSSAYPTLPGLEISSHNNHNLSNPLPSLSGETSLGMVDEEGGVDRRGGKVLVIEDINQIIKGKEDERFYFPPTIPIILLHTSHSSIPPFIPLPFHSIKEVVIQSTPDGKMRKLLTLLLSLQRPKPLIPSTTLPSIIEASGGDMRCAIMSLQMEVMRRRGRKVGGSWKGLNEEKDSYPHTTPSPSSKDQVFSGLHSIGKILYGKRRDLDATRSMRYGDKKWEFTFNPDQLLLQESGGELATSRALDLILENSPSFFSSMVDLRF